MGPSSALLARLVPLCAVGARRLAGSVGRGGAATIHMSPSEPGVVYYVATPIGNLEDITLRALRVLREADVVASEDTRRTGILLRHHGIEGKKQLSHHEHNWRARVPDLVRRARDEGQTIAVVTDAGTPGISDPGSQLAAACALAGVRVVPVPGACAAVAAVSVAALPSPDFIFAGFVPSSGSERRRRLAELRAEPRAFVLYEAPHRLIATLEGLIGAPDPASSATEGVDTASAERATGGDDRGERGVLVARELSKVHEELWRGTLSGALAHYATLDAAGAIRGEFTLVIQPDERIAKAAADAALEDKRARAEDELRARAAAGERMSAAVKGVVAATGAPRREVYALALAMGREAWPGAS